MDIIRYMATAAILIVVVKYFAKACVTRTLAACGEGKGKALGGLLSILEIGSVILLIAEWHLADAAINGATFLFLVPYLIRRFRTWYGKKRNEKENERKETARQPWEV
jgi:hypothetical protein